MDVQFPDDWKLQIEVFDRGMFINNDKLIGKTIIDLEQRRYGDKIVQAKMLVEVKKNQLELELK